ncbi:MAG TPA: hypothetical protein VFX37_15140 [Pseudolabrys sp.]|nr:hypothetical protein [Pseudolabrys sp.]
MTTIASYADLQNAVTDYLARDQDTTLIARIPTFIQLFEAKMNRKLFVRQMESRATAVTDPTADEPEYIALPSDFQSMRRIRLTAGTQSGEPTYLQFKSNQQMDDFRTLTANVAGQPQFFTIFGSEIELAPTPAAVYTVEMIYRQNIPALASNSTNWLLTLAPDLYLYGALLEAAPYMKNDARVETWGALMAAALSDLNDLGMMSTFNAGPMQVRSAGLNVW